MRPRTEHQGQTGIASVSYLFDLQCRILFFTKIFIAGLFFVLVYALCMSSILHLHRVKKCTCQPGCRRYKLWQIYFAGWSASCLDSMTCSAHICPVNKHVKATGKIQKPLFHLVLHGPGYLAWPRIQTILPRIHVHL